MILTVPPDPIGPYRVAALYVDSARGPYRHIAGVQVWGRASRDGAQLGLIGPPDRDATAYDGPHPVIAHPPCGPWGRFSWNYQGGEGDAAAGMRAVEQVQDFGGVLEHPSGSKLWHAAELPMPGDTPDRYGGRTIEIDQCDWGHPCRKRTWLYIVGGDLPPMPPPGEHTHVMVRLLRNGDDLPELPKRYRHLTPWRLAAWLCQLASSVRP